MLSSIQISNFALNSSKIDESPLMLVDSTILADNCRTFKRLFPNVSLFYAFKSFSNTKVIASVDDLVDGYDVASVKEIETLLLCGVGSERMTYSNPVKEDKSIRRAAELGIRRFAFQSESELCKIAANAPRSSVYLRMDVSSAKGSIDFSSKFGADFNESIGLLSKAVEVGLKPQGITFHVGSQANDVNAWTKAIAKATKVVQMAADAGIKLQVMNIGGGFPVRYNTESLPIENLAVRVNEQLDIVKKEFPDLSIIAEPGRFITADSAVIVTTIIGKEQRGGKPWLFLDTGTFQSFIEIFEFGEFFYPVLSQKHLDLPLDSYALTNYALTGPTCDSYDTMTHNIQLPADLDVGDKLLITMTGAYTLVYGSEFNGFAPPRVVFVDKNQPRNLNAAAPKHAVDTNSKVDLIGV